jgi:hypothetical protein
MADAAPQVAIDPDNRRRLVRLLRASYPHADFPDGPYERTADAVVASVAGSVFQGVTLNQGLDSLDAAASGSFVDLDDTAAFDVLKRLEDAAFFKLIRSVAVVSLYNDHEVWELLGYEGSSFEKGGYLHRGFDDLDWLPSPRIEEYDGPEELVEVAEIDRPTNGGAR